MTFDEYAGAMFGINWKTSERKYRVSVEKDVKIPIDDGVRHGSPPISPGGLSAAPLDAPVADGRAFSGRRLGQVVLPGVGASDPCEAARITDGDEAGFLKVYCKRGTDTILGATIVARHAGEMISEITTAMAAGMGLGSFSGVIHPYPTQAEGIRKAADQYNRTKLTPTVSGLLKKWFSLTR